METVKISVDINVNLSESTQEFIKNLFSVGVKASESVVKESATEVTETKRTRKKKVEAPAEPEAEATPEVEAPAEPEAEAEAEAPAEPEAEAEAPAVSIEDVRKVLAEKVNEHRAAIKDKLTELGAPSVTKLGPSKYNEMYNFLKSL